MLVGATVVLSVEKMAVDLDVPTADRLVRRTVGGLVEQSAAY